MTALALSSGLCADLDIARELATSDWNSAYVGSAKHVARELTAGGRTVDAVDISARPLTLQFAAN